jgi:hypothetical protein
MAGRGRGKGRIVGKAGKVLVTRGAMAHLAKARDGIRKHGIHANLARRTLMRRGFVPLSIEKNMTLPNGKVIRPDAIYVNHATKRIVVEDVFTGPDEPLKHILKTHLAADAPAVGSLLRQKYDITFVTFKWNPKHLH